MRRFATILGCAALAVLWCWNPIEAQLDKLKNTKPEERAKIQTELMDHQLGLTADQKPKIAAINLEYAKKAQPVLESGRPFAEMRELKELDQQKDAALKPVLTPDQYTKYAAGKEELRQKLDERLMQKATP